MNLFLGYWLFGIIIFLIISYKEEKQITVGDIFNYILFSIIWPLVMIHWIHQKYSHIVLLKKK